MGTGVSIASVCVATGVGLRLTGIESWSHSLNGERYS